MIKMHALLSCHNKYLCEITESEGFLRFVVVFRMWCSGSPAFKTLPRDFYWTIWTPTTELHVPNKNLIRKWFFFLLFCMSVCLPTLTNYKTVSPSQITYTRNVFAHRTYFLRTNVSKNNFLFRRHLLWHNIDWGIFECMCILILAAISSKWPFERNVTWCHAVLSLTLDLHPKYAIKAYEKVHKLQL